MNVISMSGAGNEIRTRDLNLGKVALYQLSYSRILALNYTTTKSNFEAKQTRWPENLKHTKTKKGKRWLPFLIERCWHFFRVFGAGNEIRTRDLNLGKVALYQLSYSRVFRTT